MRLFLSSVRCVRRRLSSERGFTLIELMIALGITLVALMALAYTATIGFSDIGVARQRDGANGLANQAMEQIRGLPFDTIRKGLSSSDLAGDANIVTCHGTLKCYGPLNETIPVSSYSAGTVITPLVPHVKTIKDGVTTFIVSSYVTYYQDKSNQNSAFRAIVTVTWNNSIRKGLSTRVENQSVLYSGNGCLSTATHPFAAPCQPFFYGTAIVQPGHVDTTGNMPNANFARGTLWLADINSSMQIEQVSSIAGNTQTSGVSMLYQDAPETFKNRSQVSSAADNDPAQADPDYQTASLPNLSSKTITVSGTTGSLWVTSRSGDAGSTTSTVTANLGTHPCQTENDNQPCGNATDFPAQNGVQKTMTTNVDLVAGSTDLGTAALATMDSPATQSLVYTDRAVTSGAVNCAGASGDGCIHVEGTRYLGELTLGALPPNLPPGSAPLGWLGYLVRVSNFTDTAKLEVGKGTKAPTVTASGTISYWNGAGYSTLAVAPGASVSIPVAPVSILLPLFPGGPLTVNVSVSGFKTGGTSLADPANCGANCVRASADVISNSPILGDVLYTITYNTAVLADLDIHVDMGSLEAHGEYQSAPTG